MIPYKTPRGGKPLRFSSLTSLKKMTFIFWFIASKMAVWFCIWIFLVIRFKLKARPNLESFQRKQLRRSWRLENQIDFHHWHWSKESWLRKWKADLTLNWQVLFQSQTRVSSIWGFIQKKFQILLTMTLLKSSFRRGIFQFPSWSKRISTIPSSEWGSFDLGNGRYSWLFEIQGSSQMLIESHFPTLKQRPLARRVRD